MIGPESRDGGAKPVGTLLNEVSNISQLIRLEVHGVPEELAKLRDPLSRLAPTYFTLEYGIRRP